MRAAAHKNSRPCGIQGRIRSGLEKTELVGFYAENFSHPRRGTARLACRGKNHQVHLCPAHLLRLGILVPDDGRVILFFGDFSHPASNILYSGLFGAADAIFFETLAHGPDIHPEDENFRPAVVLAGNDGSP